MTKNQPIVLDFIAKKYQSGELDDDDLVAIIKLIEPYRFSALRKLPQ